MAVSNEQKMLKERIRAVLGARRKTASDLGETDNEKKVYHSGTGESITLGHEYDWENMLDSYSGTYSGTEADAVATLMRDLGWAYGVEYGTGSTQSGSGGEGAAKLVDVFKYKSEAVAILPLSTLKNYISYKSRAGQRCGASRRLIGW